MKIFKWLWRKSREQAYTEVLLIIEQQTMEPSGDIDRFQLLEDLHCQFYPPKPEVEE